MRRVARAAIGVSSLVWVVASAQQAPPRFVAGVDVVEIDVAVRDKDHKPVRGLKAEDFTIREDGEPVKIVAFDEVYSEPPKPPSAPWMRDVAPDVETNTPADHNLFVIILDDALLPYARPVPVRGVKNAPYRLQQSKAVARRVIEGLTNQDVAAVILTNDGWSGANFTSDRNRLLAAVERMTPGPVTVDCPQLRQSAETVQTAVEALASIPHVRKTVFYITVGGIGILGASDSCGQLYDVVHLAQRSNVNIYTFDPNGLRADITDFDRHQIQTLQELASNTGGRSIVNTNDLEAHVAEILDESRAYYLIGYEISKAAADRRFHRTEVKANRPGLDVQARSMRFDPRPETRPDRIPPAIDGAVSGFLGKSDIRMTLTTAAFANADGTAQVEIALNGQLPDPVAGQARDSVHLGVRVFTTDGRSVSAANHNIPIVLETAEPNPSAGNAKGPAFSLSSDVSLKPGAYSLRLGVESAATGKTGSIYSDIVVPDFAKLALSLSGILMTASTGSSLRGDPLTVLEPTASRRFAHDDRMQAFLRIYQGGQAAPSAVTMHVRIVDEHDVGVVDRTETLPVTVFSRERQADYAVRLPLSTLKTGEYWLAIEAKGGKASATRDVRFQVR
jgi:VWFA-related protein